MTDDAVKLAKEHISYWEDEGEKMGRRDFFADTSDLRLAHAVLAQHEEIERLRDLVCNDGEQIVEWKRNHSELCAEVQAGIADRDRLREALREALDRWESFAVGSESPTYQLPSEYKRRRHGDRIDELRKLLGT